MRRRTPLLAVLVTLLASGCFAGRSGTELPVAAPAPRAVYVAVGASESVGVGADNPVTESWPQVLFRTAMPIGTVFYDVAAAGATVREALADQVPRALELAPTVVTVWLNVNDITAFVPVERYEEDLRTLVHDLRRSGRTRVLLANTPPLDELPALVRLHLPEPAVAQAVARYDDAIARVAAAEGADLVDLHAAGVTAIADGTFPSLVSGDGFHPSTPGHAAVARAFARVLAASTAGAGHTGAVREP
jgi:acyl-CoA thioesterase-1